MRRLTSTAKSVQGIDGKDHREHIAQVVETCQQFAKLLSKTSVLEEIHCVDSNDADLCSGLVLPAEGK